MSGERTIPAKGWAIIGPISRRDMVLGFTFSGTRSGAIKALIRLYDRTPHNTWTYWKRRGHRAVRVELREARA